MNGETTEHVTMKVDRVGDQIVIDFESGETLVLAIDDALSFAALVKHVATSGRDRLDDLHQELVAPELGDPRETC